MLPGVDGHLVSSAYLEAEITSAGESAPAARARGRLVVCRAACTGLGPASSARAIVETAAIPLAKLLGFDSPSDTEIDSAAVVTTVRGGVHPIVMIVVPWGAPYDPLWRLAVTHAGRRGA